MAWRRPSARRPQRRGVTSDAESPACNDAPETVVSLPAPHTRTRMNAGADSLLTVRWRDRSFVLRAPEQVEELARRLRQKGLANIAVSITGAVVEGKTGSGKVLSDEEREAVCAVLTDAESDPALRRAFNLLCAEPGPWEATRLQVVILSCGAFLRRSAAAWPVPSGRPGLTAPSVVPPSGRRTSCASARHAARPSRKLGARQPRRGWRQPRGHGSASPRGIDGPTRRTLR